MKSPKLVWKIPVQTVRDVNMHNFELLIFVASAAAFGIAIWRAKHGIVPKIRELPALAALEDLVGRAAEMGKPVHFGTGYRGLDTPEAPIVVAGLAILGHVAELCGKYKVPIHYTAIWSYNIPIGRDLIKRGYTLGGHPEMYSDDMVAYTGEHQMSYAAALMGYTLRERPAANMFFGGIAYETFNMLGAGAIAGSVQAAGTSRIYYQPFLVAACDYALIGDELYAAAAAVKKVPEETGTIRATDIIKAIALLLIILSLVLSGTALYAQLIKL